MVKMVLVIIFIYIALCFCTLPCLHFVLLLIKQSNKIIFSRKKIIYNIKSQVNYPVSQRNVWKMHHAAEYYSKMSNDFTNGS